MVCRQMDGQTQKSLSNGSYITLWHMPRLPAPLATTRWPFHTLSICSHSEYRSTALAKVLIPPEPSIHKPSIHKKTSARVLTSYENLKALEEKELKKREKEENKKRRAEERANRSEKAKSCKCQILYLHVVIHVYIYTACTYFTQYKSPFDHPICLQVTFQNWECGHLLLRTVYVRVCTLLLHMFTSPVMLLVSKQSKQRIID